MSYVSKVFYTSTGAAAPLPVPFPYINKQHVKVFVNNAVDTSWTWLTASTIRLTTARPVGAVIEIRRVTPTDARLVDFSDGSTLTQGDLNTDSKQMLFIIQEAYDSITHLMQRDDTGSFNAEGCNVSNVKDPIRPQDAVTLSYLATALAGNPSFSAAVSQALALSGLGSGEITKGDALIAVKQPFTGSALRTQHAKNLDFLSLKDFAAGDGITDDSAGIDAWVSALLLSGKAGYVPAGTYKRTTKWTLDMSSVGTRGITIYGDGIRMSTFDLTAVSASPAFNLIDSNGSTGSDSFYPTIVDVGFNTNINGIGVAIGKHDLTDAINAGNFRMYCANSSTAENSCALELNYVVQSSFNVTCNTGGTSTLGDAMRLRQAQFNTFMGCSAGNSGTGIHLTSGYNTGNIFLATDTEELKTCVKIDVETAANNTFIGGQFVWTVAGIDCTAGSNNVFINPNFGLSTNRVAGTAGLCVTGQGNSYGYNYLPNIMVSQASGDATVGVDSGTGTNRGFRFLKAGVTNWYVRADDTNFTVSRFDDTGAYLGDTVYISRSTGQMIVPKLEASTFGLATTPVARQTVTGSRGGNSAVLSILNALSALGLITNSTVA